MKNWLFLLLLSYAELFGLPLFAQSGPGAIAAIGSEAAAAQHQARFIAAAKAAGYTRAPEFYYRHRIDLTKETPLRRAGIDLRKIYSEVLIDGSYPYKEATLFADVVVRGTVVEETSDSSRQACYHTAFKVEVAEVWQGKLGSENITVKLMAGPSGKGRVSISMGPELHLGEEVVLYLSPVDFAGFADVEKLGLSICVNNAVPDDFVVQKAIAVKNSRVYGGRVKLSKVRSDTRRIAAVLDKEHFYQRDFGRVIE